MSIGIHYQEQRSARRERLYLLQRVLPDHYRALGATSVKFIFLESEYSIREEGG
jgi:hypothetical protein